MILKDLSFFLPFLLKACSNETSEVRDVSMTSFTNPETPTTGGWSLVGWFLFQLITYSRSAYFQINNLIFRDFFFASI